MATVTETQKVLIKKGDTISPENGYDLVVKEDNQFVIYEEGNLPQKKGWNPFQKTKITEVYAVSNIDQHEISVKKTVLHNSGIHSFFVTVTALYGVSDPVEVARLLRQDPVNKLKTQAGRVVAGFLKQADWEDIKNPGRFNRLKANALEDMVASGRGDAVALFDKVSDHAADFGLKLIELNFDLVLDEDTLEVDLARYEGEKQKKKSDIHTDVEEYEKQNRHKVDMEDRYRKADLDDIERIEKLKDTRAGTMAAAIERVGGNISQDIRTVEDLSQVMNEMQGLDPGNRLGNGAASSNTGGAARQLGSGQSLMASLYELMQQIHQEQLDILDQKKVLGATFRAVGTKLLTGDSAESLAELEEIRSVPMSGHLSQFYEIKIKEVGKRIDNNLLF
ncbi:MAG: hypothetical protein AAFV07_12080 [Bacteroidota bacterium]